jgi:SAM-dependent methyltransferase
LSSSFVELESVNGSNYSVRQLDTAKKLGDHDMSETNLQTLVAAANVYETLFVPALFGQWAGKVADAAQIRPGQRVLDVACGTGILGREVATRVRSSGYVVGVDPNPGMIAVAKQLAPGVEWREGTAEALPFPDQTFDAVVSQFGIMFFTDRCQALREMLRVLAPEGGMAIAVWDSLDNIPAYSSEVALLEQIAGQQAADALRAPFELGDKKILAALFADCGVVSAEITTHHGVAQFPNIRTMVEADLRGWLPVMGVFLTEDQIDSILFEADHVLNPFTIADGRVNFQLSAHIVVARKP